MSANNISMYFKVDPADLAKKETWTKINQLGEVSLGGPTNEVTEIPFSEPSDKLLIFKDANNSHASIRVYNSGLITLDIQHYVGDKNFKTLNMEALQVNHQFAANGLGHISEEYMRALEMKLVDSIGSVCKEHNCMYCPIKRGNEVWPYAVTADERLLEHDFDKLLVDVKSKWQTVRIFHSPQFGNVLMLDGDAMIGECDTEAYTQTVCAIGKEDYKDKEVLILGGGDGGILHELLKEQPKFITMAEIDEEVIKACRTHLRSVCGDSMDTYDGPNHKILIQDCVTFLHSCIQSGKTFDYVINDLTEFPVEKAVKGYGYDFETTSLITEMSLKAVKKGGKLLARGNCVTAFDYRKKFEDDLRKMGCDFLCKNTLVPSFEEVYCLYEIWRKGEISNPPSQNGC